MLVYLELASEYFVLTWAVAGPDPPGRPVMNWTAREQMIWLRLAGPVIFLPSLLWWSWWEETHTCEYCVCAFTSLQEPVQLCMQALQTMPPCPLDPTVCLHSDCQSLSWKLQGARKDQLKWIHTYRGFEAWKCVCACTFVEHVGGISKNPPQRACRSSVVHFTGRQNALLGFCLRAKSIFPSSHFPSKAICISEHAYIL